MGWNVYNSGLITVNSGVKQRLIGAIVLLTICVVLWPVVFPNTDEPKRVVETLIPEPPPLDLLDIPEQPAPQAVPNAITLLDEIRTPVEIEIIDTDVDISSLDNYSEAEALPSVDTLANEVEQAIDQPEAAWAVQVGAFSIADNAEKLAASMRDKGFSAVVQLRPHQQRQLYFVYLGPYLAKSQAEALGQQLQLSHQGARVVEFSL